MKNEDYCITDEMKKVVSKAIARNYGLYKYIEIIEKFKDVDVSSDRDFQKLFNGFFKIHSRSKEWYEGYYGFFQNHKNENLKYEDIINFCYNTLELKGKEHPVEASFSSKMLAVINPDMPILDSQVMANMGLGEITGKESKDKLKSAKKKYAEICRRYKAFEKQYPDDYSSAIELFDTIFPPSIFINYRDSKGFVYKDFKGFTNTKKIDWFLWALTREELEEIGLFKGLIK